MKSAVAVLMSLMLVVAACAPTNSTGPLPVEVLVALDAGGTELVMVPVDSPHVRVVVPLGSLPGEPLSLTTLGDKAYIGLSTPTLVEFNLSTRAISRLIALTVVPEVVKVADDGVIYAGSTEFEVINRVDLNGPNVFATFVRGGTGAFGIARGKVYAIVPNRVQCLSTDPGQCPDRSSWVTPLFPVSGDSIALSGPGNASAAVLAPDGLLYVLNSGDGFDDEGRLAVVDPVGDRESASFGGIGPQPFWIASDGGERLVIASDVGGLMVFNTRLSRMTVPFGSGVPLNSPTGLLADAVGRMYVIEQAGCLSSGGTGHIRVFSTSLVERPRINLSFCPIAGAMAEVPAERIFESQP